MPKPPLWTRAFVLVFVANFFQTLAFHLFIHFPGHLREQGSEETIIGVVMAVGSVTGVLARPMVGQVMDTLGRRPVALVGAAVHLAACTGYLFTHGPGPMLYGVRVLHGVAEAMLFSVMFTLAADLISPLRRAEGIALFGLSGMLPLGIAGLLGDAVLMAGNYDHLFFVSIGSAALGGLACLPLRDNRPPESEPSRGFFQAISNPGLPPVWFAGLSFATAIASAFTFIKTFVQHTGLGSTGLFFGVYTGAAIVLRMLFAWVPEQLGLKRVLLPAMACVSLGLGLLSVAEHGLYVAAAGLLCGVGHGYAFPILSALTVTRARPSERGAALTLFTALFGVGFLAAPGFGAIEDAAGYGAMFASAAGLCALGAVGFAWWDRTATDTGPPAPDTPATA